MERLMEDAVVVKNLLSWVESEEEIINFMRKIPLDKSYLRNQLTLRYFLKKRDHYSDNFEKEIEDDAREIVLIIPDTSYKEIKEKLTVLGNTPNRKEVVLRQLLYNKHDLDNILREINASSSVKKRKTDSSNDSLTDSNSTNNRMDINIKIRKVDNSFQVFSSFSSKERPSTSTNFANSGEHIDEPTTSSVSITSSTNHSLADSPDSTVASNITEPYDPYPEFTAILNNLISSDTNPSTSESEMPVTRSNIPRLIKNKAPTISNTEDGEVVPASKERKNILQSNFPSTSHESSTACGTSNTEDVKVSKKHDNLSQNNFPSTSYGSSTVIEPVFNLIDFVKELSNASKHKIFKLCQRMNLDLHQKPSEDKLNYLLNQLLDDVVEIKSVESSDSESTEEYDYVEHLNGDQPIFLHNTGAINKIPKDKSKKFTLKEPILNLSNKLQVTHEPIMAPIIQPARFNPPPTIENTIPAMPTAYLNAMNGRLDQMGQQKHYVYNEIPQPGPSKFPIIVPDNHETSAIDMFDNGQAEALITKDKIETVCDEKLVLKLIEMFPEACPNYIRNVSNGKKFLDLDEVLTIILSEPDYPRRPQRERSPAKDMDPEEQFAIVQELLPDADPTYLRMHCEKYANDEILLKEFINQAMETKQYPTMKDYLRKQQLSAQQKQYTTDFNIENFIQLFPNPEETFSNLKRTNELDSYSIHYINIFFRNRYTKISAKVIQNILHQYKYRLLACDKMLEKMIDRNNFMLKNRRKSTLPQNIQDIPVLQELAYISHKEDIKNYLLEKQKREEQERVDAKNKGLVETCQCCYDEEVMPKDCFSCPNGCKFCKDCIKKSCEVAMGDGKTDFCCLANCSDEFSLQTLQSVLPPKMFSKLAQKKALAEIKAAGIEELETCPFCDFASIPHENDKIFRCLNPDCMKESCRACKEPNHVPLKCEEVEKDEDVKARTYVENQMTEALIRKCWKCKISFFKEEGCNKMTCSCGASMCYICQKPVTDYTHFNGMGGDKYHLCALYSDTNKINQENVVKAAQAAKNEINPVNLKVDPTKDIAAHYQERSKKLPHEPHLNVLQRMNRPAGRRRPHRQLRVDDPQVLYRHIRQLRNQIAEQVLRNRRLQFLDRNEDVDNMLAAEGEIQNPGLPFLREVYNQRVRLLQAFDNIRPRHGPRGIVLDPVGLPPPPPPAAGIREYHEHHNNEVGVLANIIREALENRVRLLVSQQTREEQMPDRTPVAAAPAVRDNRITIPPVHPGAHPVILRNQKMPDTTPVAVAPAVRDNRISIWPVHPGAHPVILRNQKMPDRTPVAAAPAVRDNRIPIRPVHPGAHPVILRVEQMPDRTPVAATPAVRDNRIPIQPVHPPRVPVILRNMEMPARRPVGAVPTIRNVQAFIQPSASNATNYIPRIPEQFDMRPRDVGIDGDMDIFPMPPP